MSVLAACSDAMVEDDNANILARIWEPDVHLALWRRLLPDSLMPLASLDWEQIDDIDEPVSRETVAADLPAYLEAAGYAGLTPALADEILPLCARFAAIMDCSWMKLRLEVVETDACRKFHADNVSARLLMPLVGPGTQWVHTGDDDIVQALQPGEVGLFKGWKWTEAPRILHRSPPVAATGETRLLFALSPVERNDVA
ncbi:DUF1826 domain-containing protein [Sphingobium sp.]|uniref:DUF1826 domain-containing protein n=1 Tax=Sphingobium sp. TaxID=1912891 RepID=UPI00261333B9|nr:DUF1826 domain-containing protein [Sphingobium sp.]